MLATDLKANPIGVTDSGLGGLSVLRELQRQLPRERFIYLADQSYMPYGDKPFHEISDRVFRLATWYQQQQCKALVLACNTATAIAVTRIRQSFPNWPVVAIEPAVKPASLMTKNGCIGILATANTLASERLKNLVAQYQGVVKVVAEPCPGLVELIEQNPNQIERLRAYLQPRLAALLAQQVDVIVLGCTHYPFVRQLIEDLAGPYVQVIDTGFAVARQLKTVLAQHDLLWQPVASCSEFESQPFYSSPGNVQWYTTSDAAAFQRSLIQLLGDQWSNSVVNHLPI